MNKILVKENIYGKYITGKIEIFITAEIGDEPITEEQAKQILAERLDNLAGSNDGSEELANAEIQIVYETT